MRTVTALLFLTLTCFANDVLTVEGGPVSMRAHRVKAKVRDRVAEVVVEHVFFNASTQRLEGQYVFPLPDGATVSAFSMTMGGKMIKGEVLERGKARRIYERIVSKRRDPGLLEKVDRGVYRARVFPIEPRSELTIRLAYQQLLPESAGTIEMRYPVGRGRASIDVDIESTADLSTVYCPSHEVETVRDGKRNARVAWEGRSAKAQDFLLYLARAEGAVAFSLLSHRVAAEPGTFLAVLTPITDLKEEEIQPKDVVYVIDVSGSMRGEKLKQARAALQFGIESLRKHDRFNIVAFSTASRRFRPAPVPLNRDTRAAALAWVDALDANGGTALDEAMQTSLTMLSAKRLSIVALLTDGLPSVGIRDPKSIVERVKTANHAGARVFVFGVGFDQNVAFLDRIARNTRASREYVTSDGNLELVVSRFFRRIDRPVLTDLELDLGDGVTDVYPRALPDLFAGDQLVVAGRYTKSGPRALRLEGKLHGKKVTYVYEGTLAERATVAPLPRLWAQRKVEFLVEQIDVHGRSKELVDEIVRLGTKHSIVTRYTAGLVVEEEEAMMDAPFTGATTNAAIGLGGSVGHRRARGGMRNLRAGGGSGLSENVVELGLVRLASLQRHGVWGSVEDTSLALLAFLARGYTDRGSRRDNKYAKIVRAGLRDLLVGQRDDGSFGESLIVDITATRALCEAFWVTRNPRYKRPAQDALNRLSRARTSDVMENVHLVMALKAGKIAGLEVDPDGFERARVVFDAARGEPTPAQRAAVVYARILLGHDQRGVAMDFGTIDGDDLDHLRFATLATFQVGGKTWRRWNEQLREFVARLPSKRGEKWDGDVKRTATYVLAVTVYYRYPRIFR